MTIFKSGLRWVVIGALALIAFAAVLNSHPATTTAQTPTDESECAVEGEGGAVDVGAPPYNEPTPEPKPVEKASVEPIPNLDRRGPTIKRVDLVLLQGPATHNRVRVWGKLHQMYPAQVPNAPVIIADVQAAIVAINTEFNTDRSPQGGHAAGTKLNVVIAGHGLPGQVSVGNEVIGNVTQAQAKSQNKFINGDGTKPGAKGKIQHLKFVSCETAFGDRGLRFLQKLSAQLGADQVGGAKTIQVTGFTKPIFVTGDPSITDNFAANPELNNNYVQFTNDGKRQVGGIVLDPADTGALQLQTDSSSGSDAWLLAEIAAGTAAATVVLGGGVWYARRRRVQ